MIGKKAASVITLVLILAPLTAMPTKAQGTETENDKLSQSQTLIHQDILDQLEINGCIYIPGWGWIC